MFYESVVLGLVIFRGSLLFYNYFNSIHFFSDGQSSCADDAVKFTGIINHSKICDAKCLQTAVKGIINARRGEGCSPFLKNAKKSSYPRGQNNTLCLVVYSYEVQV